MPAPRNLRIDDDSPLRVMLFTDTLGDVNGVSRFLQNAALHAAQTGRTLRIMTSTRKPVPVLPTIMNVPPRIAFPMPAYPDLDLVLPRGRAMLAHARAFSPHVIHVSTPGPVGLVGRWVARKLGVPLAGVYHTDFPAYVEHLFADEAMVWAARAAMARFYRPFDTLLARSAEHAPRLGALGLPQERVRVLHAGIRTHEFHPRFRTGRGEDNRLRVLYVGRVSVEKNLPLLARAWRRAHAALVARGIACELLVVGDGPYRDAMARNLPGGRFTGFLHAEELSRAYASSDLFVFPSETDTLGQAVMEAQASGLAAIVSDRGGPCQIVRDQATGLVLPGHDAARWAWAIESLALDPGTRARMGAAGHEAMQAFSFEASFEAFWRIHAELARAHPASPPIEGPRHVPGVGSPAAGVAQW